VSRSSSRLCPGIVCVPYVKMYDADWICFFLRTVTPNNDLLPPKPAAQLKPFPALKAFILWVLVRDPNRRPMINDMRVTFAAIRRKFTGGPPSVSTTTVAVDRVGGLWVIGAGGGTALPPRWPVAPGAPKPISIATLFPALSALDLKRLAMTEDAAAVPTVRGWRLSPGGMAPAFMVASSGLNTIFFSDVVALLGTTLCDSGIVAAIICTRDLDRGGCDVWRGDRTRSRAKHIFESDAVVRFCQMAASAGIEKHTASLPCVTTHDDGGAQLRFSAVMHSAVAFARRALFLAGLGLGKGVGADKTGSARRGRVLLIGMPDDATVAMAVAASIYMSAHDGSICAATVALSPASTLEADCPTLHPTDVARLLAWEARVHADAALLNGKSCIQCPNGCWSVTLKAPLRLSSHPMRCNPHPCLAALSGRCEDGCPGLHLGVTGACSTICESLALRADHVGDGAAVSTLWWVHTTADSLVPGMFCAHAHAGGVIHRTTSVADCGYAVGDAVRSVVAEPKGPEVEDTNAWQLFTCGCCRSVTHAVAKGETGPTRQVAVIANNSSGLILASAVDEYMTGSASR